MFAVNPLNSPILCYNKLIIMLRHKSREEKVMRTETVILTNMCMVYDDAGNVLVQDKVDKKWSGLTFPGGHIEKGESFVDSVIREVYEETGLTIEKPRICGTKDWLSLIHISEPTRRS